MIMSLLLALGTFITSLLWPIAYARLQARRIRTGVNRWIAPEERIYER